MRDLWLRFRHRGVVTVNELEIAHEMGGLYERQYFRKRILRVGYR